MLEREILELVAPDRKVSIEGEIWPLLVGEGLYGFPSESYWMDIGTPARYLQGTFDILEGNVESAVRGDLGEDWLAIDETRRGARPRDPAGADRGRLQGRRGRPRRQPGGAGTRRHGRPGQHASSGPWCSTGPTSAAGCELRDCIVCEGAVVGDAHQGDRWRGARRRCAYRG